MQTSAVKGADLTVQALDNEGVERITGVPGEANLDFLEALRSSSIKLVVSLRPIARRLPPPICRGSSSTTA
jgi:Thiamine pyrophosphate enzyme, N-terminal TPP binding domain